jgi:hypothetical protein
MIEKDESKKYCQYFYPDFIYSTLPDSRKALSLRKCWWKFKRYIFDISVLGLFSFIKQFFILTFFSKKNIKFKKRIHSHNLNLQPEEIVEVRSAKEIFNTLDKDGKLRGLRFTPEMRKFCGKRFKVLKRLNKIIIETTGELRIIKTPTVILEGVFCDGRAHGNCDRMCFCFWREAWLKRVKPENSSINK